MRRGKDQKSQLSGRSPARHRSGDPLGLSRRDSKASRCPIRGGITRSQRRKRPIRFDPTAAAWQDRVIPQTRECDVLKVVRLGGCTAWTPRHDTSHAMVRTSPLGVTFPSALARGRREPERRGAPIRAVVLRRTTISSPRPRMRSITAGRRGPADRVRSQASSLDRKLLK